MKLIMRDYYNKEISGDDIALACYQDKCRIVWNGLKPIGLTLDGQRPEGIPADWWLSEPDFRQSVRVASGEWDCIALPVKPEDQSRVDEKYPLKGYRSIDARAGVNWGENDEI